MISLLPHNNFWTVLLWSILHTYHYNMLLLLSSLHLGQAIRSSTSYHPYTWDNPSGPQHPIIPTLGTIHPVLNILSSLHLGQSIRSSTSYHPYTWDKPSGPQHPIIHTLGTSHPVLNILSSLHLGQSIRSSTSYHPYTWDNPSGPQHPSIFVCLVGLPFSPNYPMFDVLCNRHERYKTTVIGTFYSHLHDWIQLFCTIYIYYSSFLRISLPYFNGELVKQHLYDGRELRRQESTSNRYTSSKEANIDSYRHGNLAPNLWHRCCLQKTNAFYWLYPCMIDIKQRDIGWHRARNIQCNRSS